jgi:serralysin
MATTTRKAIDALLAIRNGDPTARWNFPAVIGSAPDSGAGIGQSVKLTFSFLSGAPAYFSGAGLSGFRSMNAVERQATETVLGQLASWLNIQFTATQTDGQLGLGMSSQAPDTSGQGFYPAFGYTLINNKVSSVAASPATGDVWLNQALNRPASDWNPGGSGYATLLHELSHALGLKHPFEAPANGYLLDPSLDNERYTVMAYNPATNTNLITVTGSASSYSYTWRPISPSTLMPLDLEALQHLYGANKKYRKGDNTYRWARDVETLETIVDSGGNDTIDTSNQRLSCRLDLRPGAFSSIAIRSSDSEKRSALGLPDWFTAPLPDGTYDGRDNVAIAAGVTIENAIGGSAADVLIGNRAANLLCGGPGRDLMTGGVGTDRFLFKDKPTAANRDRITDFQPANDRILLDDDIFQRFSGNAAGIPLAATHLRIGSAPGDADDFLVYNPTNDLLAYAPNGNLSAMLQPIATIPLAPSQTLTAESFLIVA